MPNTRNTWDLEIFRAQFSGLRVWLSAPVLQLSAGCQLDTWGSPCQDDIWSHPDIWCHLASDLSWAPVPSLITDWPPTLTSPLSLLYLDPGQLKVMNRYGSRDLVFRLMWFIFQAGWGSFKFIISGSQQIIWASLWSCYLGLQMRFGRERGGREGRGPCNQPPTIIIIGMSARFEFIFVQNNHIQFIYSTLPFIFI